MDSEKLKFSKKMHQLIVVYNQSILDGIGLGLPAQVMSLFDRFNKPFDELGEKERKVLGAIADDLYEPAEKKKPKKKDK